MSGCTAIVVARPSSNLVSAHKQLERIRKQEHAIRVVRFWTSASQKALNWSQHWTWPCSPHVIELGEDIMAIIAYADDSSLLVLASTCRCLRGLILPRLLEKKTSAVRQLYLTGALA